MNNDASALLRLTAQWKLLRARVCVAYAEREVADVRDMTFDHGEELIRLWDQITVIEARIAGETPQSVEDVAAILDVVSEILGCRETHPESALARGPVAKLVRVARDGLTRIEEPSLV